MEFTNFSDDIRIIQKLSDKPNAVDGLNADQMKKKFDEAGLLIQNYLNNILLVELIEKVAPSGFGLGSQAKQITDLDTATECGWYAFGEGCNNAPFGYGCCIAINRYNTSVVQVAFDIALSAANHNGAIARRVKSADQYGTWDAWEYINPPMELGIEYRTCDRFNNKPVYTKLVNVGAMPNATSLQAVHGIGNIRDIVACGGVAVSETSFTHGVAFPLAYESSSSGRVDLYCNASTVFITATTDWSHREAYVWLKYTKTTD